MNVNEMKLYLITNVLHNYGNEGMVAIAAENLEQCREIFDEEFATCSNCHRLKAFDNAIQYGYCQELEVKADTQPGVITYVEGGN
jgi:hypothetical protein